MNASCARGDRHCNGSARRRASVRWSASGSESGVGKGGAPGAVPFLEGGPANGCRESAPDARDELAILIDPRRCAYIHPVLRWANENVGAGMPGNRRTLRPLSPAPAGGGTGDGAVAGAVRPVVARGGMPAPATLRAHRWLQAAGCGAHGTHLPSVGPALHSRPLPSLRDRLNVSQ